MKKILRQGSIKKYRAKCPVCDTDVIYINDLPVAVVECPDCGMPIQHKENPSSNITIEQL